MNLFFDVLTAILLALYQFAIFCISEFTYWTSSESTLPFAKQVVPIVRKEHREEGRCGPEIIDIAQE